MTDRADALLEEWRAKMNSPEWLAKWHENCRLEEEHQKAIDPDDFCRACKGKGYTHERTERGTVMMETCYRCRGTKRNFLVFPKDESK